MTQSTGRAAVQERHRGLPRAAFIVEPVQGEGGYYPAPPEFLQRLRSLADQHGILLIADEIQTGVARVPARCSPSNTAAWCPTLITSGHILGGGFPIAAVVESCRHHGRAQPGGLGSTHAGAPMACAAALAVPDVVESGGPVPARNHDRWLHMQVRLRELAARQRSIGEVRGPGAMGCSGVLQRRRSCEAGSGSAQGDRGGGRSSAVCCCSPAASTMCCD